MPRVYKNVGLLVILIEQITPCSSLCWGVVFSVSCISVCFVFVRRVNFVFYSRTATGTDAGVVCCRQMGIPKGLLFEILTRFRKPGRACSLCQNSKYGG